MTNDSSSSESNFDPDVRKAMESRNTPEQDAYDDLAAELDARFGEPEELGQADSSLQVPRLDVSQEGLAGGPFSRWDTGRITYVAASANREVPASAHFAFGKDIPTPDGHVFHHTMEVDVRLGTWRSDKAEPASAIIDEKIMAKGVDKDFLKRFSSLPSDTIESFVVLASLAAKFIDEPIDLHPDHLELNEIVELGRLVRIAAEPTPPEQGRPSA